MAANVGEFSNTRFAEFKAATHMRHRLVLQRIHPRQAAHGLLIQSHGFLRLLPCGILGIQGPQTGMKGLTWGHGESLARRRRQGNTGVRRRQVRQRAAPDLEGVGRGAFGAERWPGVDRG